MMGIEKRVERKVQAGEEGFWNIGKMEPVMQQGLTGSEELRRSGRIDETGMGGSDRDCPVERDFCAGQKMDKRIVRMSVFSV